MKDEDITLIDLCYRYGASPAAQTLVTVPLLSTQRLDPSLIENGEPCGYLIELMRYRRDLYLKYSIKSTREKIERTQSEFWLWYERLNFYSLLMVAQLTQTIPSSLPEPFIEAARMEFGDYPPGLYAESGFPLAAAFLLKLEGQYEETASTKASDVFHRLLALDATVRTDQSMMWAWYLARLRPSRVFQCGIGYFLSVSNLTRSLTREESNKVFSFRATWSFLHFCKNLHELLSGIEDRTVAGLVRHYYSYVLDIYNDHDGSALWSCVTALLQVEWDGAEDHKEGFEAERDSLVRKVDTLRTPFLEVTNRELWPLPSNLEFPLTDKQMQPTE